MALTQRQKQLIVDAFYESVADLGSIEQKVAKLWDTFFKAPVARKADIQGWLAASKAKRQERHDQAQAAATELQTSLLAEIAQIDATDAEL